MSIRVGIIGLGDIARKAYLPVLAARADVEPVLCTRDGAVLRELGDAYRVPHRFTSVAAMLDAGIDAAFVHTATASHAEVASALLAAGVPTYVDKPLADNLADAAALVTLAEERGVSLMVGFNRRYAPVYALLAASAPEFVVMQKNRVDLPDTPRRVIFDDFVHVLDTLRFLAPTDPAALGVQATVRDGLLRRVVVEIGGAVGVMDRCSGAVEEILEVFADGEKRRVVDMGDTWVHAGGEIRRVRRGDWVPATTQRGFDAVCDAFLAAAREGRVLSARDALATHELCERVVEAVESA